MGKTLQAKLQLSKCMFLAQHWALSPQHTAQATDQGQTHALQIQQKQELCKLSVLLQSAQSLQEEEPQTTPYDLSIWVQVNPHVHLNTFQEERKRDKSVISSVTPKNSEL